MIVCSASAITSFLIKVFGIVFVPGESTTVFVNRVETISKLSPTETPTPPFEIVMVLFSTSLATIKLSENSVLIAVANVIRISCTDNNPVILTGTNIPLTTGAVPK